VRIDLRLGEALCDLIERTNRDIPLSDLFVKLLCGRLEPTPDLLDWCEARGLEVNRNTEHEFIFRAARPAADSEEREDCGSGEFVGSLFEL
jgi:hypothetical protein